MPSIEGNSVVIYNDGDEFYPAMLEAIESARYSVTMEQFIFGMGEWGSASQRLWRKKRAKGFP